jgi:hypothetical protein
MSWPRALAYVGAAIVLALVYFTVSPPASSLPPGALTESAAQPHPTIDSVRIDAGNRTVRARRAGEQWEVVEPATSKVPSDLIAALVNAVMDAPAQPVARETDRLTDFGLDTPSARLTFGRPDAPAVTLSLGRTNPAETGIYGQLEGNPQIVLLGLNVQYYVDMVLKQSGYERASSGD